MLNKIISGGQTGVDQAALDAAIACGIAYGGWLPAGRKTENGPLPARYKMEELATSAYPARTRKNVVESDATLIISHGPLTGGSALTAKIASEGNVPYYHLDLDEEKFENRLVPVKRWLQEVRPDVLNIAGPRTSSDSSIYQKSFDVIVELLKINNNNGFAAIEKTGH